MSPLDPDPAVRYPAMAAMRERCPVHELVPGRYLVLDHAATATGLRSVHDFGGSAGQRGLPEEDTTISAIPEPRHGEVRRIINSVVAFHKSQQIEPYLSQFIEDRMAELRSAATHGPVEVMSIFVEPIPPAAMARLLGFAESESRQYFTWSDQLAVAFGQAAAEGRSVSMREACPEMAAYVEDRIAERRALPQDSWPNDALTRFLSTDVAGESLSTRAITTQIMFSIGAGSDTTRNVLGSLLYRLAQDAPLYERIKSDRDLIEPAIEEALRLDSPAQYLVRQCLAETFTLGGQPLNNGDTVMLGIGGANRDPAVFDEPDQFDPTRGNVRDHLGFGTGPHICPGSALARLEMRMALNAWCDAVDSFRLADDYSWQSPATGIMHGPTSLTLVIEPA